MLEYPVHVASRYVIAFSQQERTRFRDVKFLPISPLIFDVSLLRARYVNLAWISENVKIIIRRRWFVYHFFCERFSARIVARLITRSLKITTLFEIQLCTACIPLVSRTMSIPGAPTRCDSENATRFCDSTLWSNTWSAGSPTAVGSGVSLWPRYNGSRPVFCLFSFLLHYRGRNRFIDP